jgi:hypothetical protein
MNSRTLIIRRGVIAAGKVSSIAELWRHGVAAGPVAAGGCVWAGSGGVRPRPAAARARRWRGSGGAACHRLATANAGTWRLDRLRARLRLADRQAEAAEALALRRRELAAGLVALNATARRDARGRLILAGLAQAAVAARTRLDALGGEIALLARQQRAAAAALALRTARRPRTVRSPAGS